MLTLTRRRQIERAAFTATNRDVRRRRALRRIVDRNCPKNPELSYYLAIGSVPRSLWEND